MPVFLWALVIPGAVPVFNLCPFAKTILCDINHILHYRF
ncbi:hypothetical protein TREAZ_0214 [Leadbettera azotonutricia ZAS-9]|uniref:Uncharacterized protein n=1 Tax=Leadbettera azotonutricia (strain ATCC BAA-888 / DSM 13862 / ZAS-9) TaxID=545695 RepID=F5YEB1_LEAAZ|nr:hypothetical protein TREAZ_0214 [Leadbettera azotonutricia ZAS-9]